MYDKPEVLSRPNRKRRQMPIVGDDMPPLGGDPFPVNSGDLFDIDPGMDADDEMETAAL